MTSRPAWRPGPEQQRLLDACLLEDDRARRAFADWRARVDVERLDAGSHRLLPLLWKRISALGIDDPSSDVLKGVYRRTWYVNQILLARTAKLIHMLTAAGIPALVLKGMVLALRNYRDPGVRPMSDADVAVPRAQARQAIAVLVGAGWEPGVTPLTGAMVAGAAATSRWTVGPRPLEAFDDAYFGVRHAHGFKGPDGEAVDLHWCLFQGQCDAGTDDAAWAAAQPFAVRDESALALDPADHLLLQLAHGSRANPIAPLRWVADAVTLVRTEPRLRWERLVDQARAREITLLAGEMLGYLVEAFGVEVPREVLSDLRGTRPTARERRDYRMRVSVPSVATGVEELRYLWVRYRRLRGRVGARRMPFPAFVRHVLGATNLLQVGLYALREVKRRTSVGRRGGRR